MGGSMILQAHEEAELDNIKRMIKKGLRLAEEEESSQWVDIFLHLSNLVESLDYDKHIIL
jgi:hypothetical protein